ncbi:Thioredoxin-2 [Dissophora globulifera]|uniref:Thioredoxin-2 n=1 Tax=Dissophora globulifera TaxID=979702 RepID=A0A9P6RNT4_9FUNG|nr:Thioredoxin-2 [Dissophora globulifera]KAG0324621.1 Thioredoxin-2 [Dissophora globulifera]
MASPYILSPNTDSELDKILLEHRNRLVVLVFTTAWCKNCKRLSSAIEDIAEDLSKVSTFVHVDVDELLATVKKHNVEVTPTFAVFRGHVFQTSISATLLPKQPTPEESDDQLLSWVSNTIRSFAQHWNASYSKITDHLAFSPTLEEYQIKDGLAKVGFRSVIGMESKQNPGEYLAREEDLWNSVGIQFFSYPIKSADEISLVDFEEILQLVETLPGPILIHSEIGQVAAIMVFVMVAKQNKRMGHEVAGWARELGFDFEGLGRLTQTIQAWVDN